jgi:hypothetical protein
LTAFVELESVIPVFTQLNSKVTQSNQVPSHTQSINI